MGMEICGNLSNDSAPGQFGRLHPVDRIGWALNFHGGSCTGTAVRMTILKAVKTVVRMDFHGSSKKSAVIFLFYGGFNRHENGRLALFSAS